MVLRTYCIDQGIPGPHLLISGGVHGDEFEPLLAIDRLRQSPELSAIRGKLTLLPVANESAFARGTRVGSDGLDLARTCPGREQGSPTEQVAWELSGLIRSADYYIDLHTGGLAYTVWPMTGYVLHPNAAVLERQRALARAFNLPVIWGTDYRLEGRSLSVARDANVPAIYAEFAGGGRCSPTGIQAYVTGCLEVLGLLGMRDYQPAPSQVQITVEDDRPQSGHMQRCYPSPAAGCFLPTVEVGQRVQVGQPLGHVIDPASSAEHIVLAEHTGRILVLRVYPAVQTGDSLAVILETAA